MLVYTDSLISIGLQTNGSSTGGQKTQRGYGTSYSLRSHADDVVGRQCCGAADTELHATIFLASPEKKIPLDLTGRRN